MRSEMPKQRIPPRLNLCARFITKQKKKNKYQAQGSISNEKAVSFVKCDQQGIFAQNNIALNPTLHRNAAAMMQCINPNLIAVAFQLRLLFQSVRKKNFCSHHNPIREILFKQSSFSITFCVSNKYSYVLRSTQMYLYLQLWQGLQN